MRRCYLSKHYKETASAGNKAKTDMEAIMERHGFINVGLPPSYSTNKLLGFFYTFFSVLKSFFSLHKGDILLLQYPFKKYYTLVCRFAHWKGAKTITLIHDLGSFRRKKLTVEQEKKRLSNTDYIIALNATMRSWLKEQGYTQEIGALQVWDYLSERRPKESDLSPNPYQVVYAGGLSPRKNLFLYELEDIINGWHFSLHGNGFDSDRLKNKKNYTYNGYTPSEKLIETAEGDFGLVWDGDSTERCSGAFGEYLQYNNPHKMSLYIRCHLPIIIWKKAALATFVEEHNIGICVNSLEELNQILPSMSLETYKQLKKNITTISEKVAEGYYFMHAYKEAEQKIQSYV
ncbi:galactofuranosyltransferase [Parabacteroides sp. OttesenSCG-928-K15]|nr:galactofuranosyltransferase [Parabacteroides sp. OttesenSCG-928-K15]